MFFTEQNNKEEKERKKNSFQELDKITTKLGRGEIACKKLLITSMELFRKFYP
jgi:hypothetical protein